MIIARLQAMQPAPRQMYLQGDPLSNRACEHAHTHIQALEKTTLREQAFKTVKPIFSDMIGRAWPAPRDLKVLPPPRTDQVLGPNTSLWPSLLGDSGLPTQTGVLEGLRGSLTLPEPPPKPTCRFDHSTSKPARTNTEARRTVNVSCATQHLFLLQGGHQHRYRREYVCT